MDTYSRCTQLACENWTSLARYEPMPNNNNTNTTPPFGPFSPSSTFHTDARRQGG